jgi:DNA gyrase subunit A
VKKTELTAFANQRAVGLRALELDEGDTLVKTAITDGNCDVVLYSSSGKAIRFSESAVRAMGRTARGVRGIRLPQGHHMVDMIIPQQGGQILAVSVNGYGKRTSIDEFPVHGRGGQGVIGIQSSERNGAIVGAIQVFDGDEIMLISDKGTLVRTRVDEISSQGRNTQGVRLIRLKDEEFFVGVVRVEEPDDDGAKQRPAVQGTPAADQQAEAAIDDMADAAADNDAVDDAALDISDDDADPEQV